MSKSIDAAEILVRYSSLNFHPALQNSEIGIGRISWETISTTEMTRQEATLVEILRLIMIGQSSANLSDLLILNDHDLQAVLLALNTRYQSTKDE